MKTVILMILVCCSNLALGDTKRADIIPVESDDQAMNRAMAKARKNIGLFKKAIKEDAKGIEMPMLKVHFAKKDAPEEGEHMWVSDVKFGKGKISGVLQSTPGTVTRLKLGEKVTFPLSQVSDWLFVKNGVAQGAYTVQLLRSRMSAEDRAGHDASYPFKFKKLK